MVEPPRSGIAAMKEDRGVRGGGREGREKSKIRQIVGKKRSSWGYMDTDLFSVGHAVIEIRHMVIGDIMIRQHCGRG